MELYIRAEPTVCPICGCHLHGHGWRLRYQVDACGRSMTIALHRRLCSGCRMSFTLLPRGVHAFKSHSAGAVLEAIRSFIEHGRHCNCIAASKHLRKQWFRRFLISSFQGVAQSCERMLGGLKAVAGAFISPPRGLVLLKRSELLSRQHLEHLRAPHQKLLLGILPGHG